MEGGEPLLKFRHLLAAHDLTRAIFSEVKTLRSERKLLMKEGTIADATIIAAPSSSRNVPWSSERTPARTARLMPSAKAWTTA